LRPLSTIHFHVPVQILVSFITAPKEWSATLIPPTYPSASANVLVPISISENDDSFAAAMGKSTIIFVSSIATLVSRGWKFR
jgi:hypothetical protein